MDPRSKAPPQEMHQEGCAAGFSAAELMGSAHCSGSLQTGKCDQPAAAKGNGLGKAAKWEHLVKLHGKTS